MKTLRKTLAAFTTFTAAMAASVAAQAAIVNHADVNGVRTFQDTTTGYIWADLDNWMSANTGPGSGTTLHTNYGSYLGALQAAGFTWADHTVVEAMLPAIASNAEYQAAGSAMSTDWIHNIEQLAGYSSWAGGYHVHQLQFTSSGINWIDWTTATGPASAIGQGRGLWAYMTSVPAGGGGNSVPEPATYLLVGLALMAAASRTKVPARDRWPGGTTA
jgi:hypothetical protein